MTRNRCRIGRHALLAGPIFALTAAVVCTPALAQRGDRGGDRGGGGRSGAPARDSGSRRDYSPSRDSGSRGSYSPPARDYSSRRDYSPSVQRDYSPRRDYSPSVQRDYTPSRDRTPSFQRDTTPRREYTPSNRRDSWSRQDRTPSSGSDRTPRWDYRPAPQRDSAPPTRRDNSSFDRRDSGLNRDSGSNRDTFTPRRNSGSIDRTPNRGSQDTRTHDFYDFRRDEGVNRGGGTARDSGSRVDSIRRTPSRDVLGRNRDGVGPAHDGAHDIFARTEEGRRFNNGLYLRPGGYIADSHIRHYFPSAYCYYPYYAPTFEVGLTFWSPYSYYYGDCPPYIYRRHVFFVPPPAIYIEVPIYSGDQCRGYRDDLDDYYLNDGSYQSQAPGLDQAIDDIRTAFRTGDVNTLVNLTDPNVRIAVFLKGKYEYSMAPSDYLDMTRDALHTTDTITFDLYRVHRRADGVYVVSGKHVYRYAGGERRTVYVSYVLERLSGRWTLTQIGTAPDRIQEP